MNKKDLRLIVERLPKTADGFPICPGDFVYFFDADVLQLDSSVVDKAWVESISCRPYDNNGSEFTLSLGRFDEESGETCDECCCGNLEVYHTAETAEDARRNLIGQQIEDED